MLWIAVHTECEFASAHMVSQYLESRQRSLPHQDDDAGGRVTISEDILCHFCGIFGSFRSPSFCCRGGNVRTTMSSVTITWTSPSQPVPKSNTVSPPPTDPAHLWMHHFRSHETMLSNSFRYDLSLRVISVDASGHRGSLVIKIHNS